MTNECIATPIVKDECWIVERDGKKIAAILGNPTGVTLLQGRARERFPDLKTLGKKYNIKVAKPVKRVVTNRVTDIYGYPCSSAKAYNVLWDVQKKIPIFTKTAKSKSFFGAGHYLIKLDDARWSHAFCPKTIILGRHEFVGPFLSRERAENYLSSS